MCGLLQLMREQLITFNNQRYFLQIILPIMRSKSEPSFSREQPKRQQLTVTSIYTSLTERILSRNAHSQRNYGNVNPSPYLIKNSSLDRDMLIYNSHSSDPTSQWNQLQPQKSSAKKISLVLSQPKAGDLLQSSLLLSWQYPMEQAFKRNRQNKSEGKVTMTLIFFQLFMKYKKTETDLR